LTKRERENERQREREREREREKDLHSVDRDSQRHHAAYLTCPHAEVKTRLK